MRRGATRTAPLIGRPPSCRRHMSALLDPAPGNLVVVCGRGRCRWSLSMSLLSWLSSSSSSSSSSRSVAADRCARQAAVNQDPPAASTPPAINQDRWRLLASRPLGAFARLAPRRHLLYFGSPLPVPEPANVSLPASALRSWDRAHTSLLFQQESWKCRPRRHIQASSVHATPPWSRVTMTCSKPWPSPQPRHPARGKAPASGWEGDCTCDVTVG